MLQGRVSRVVGAEAGERLVLGKDNGAGIAAALDDAAQERGNGYAALGIDRVQSAALKKMIERHVLLPVRSAQSSDRKTRIVTRAASASNQRESPPRYSLCW